MFETLLPPAFACAVNRGAPTGLALFPEEAAIVRAATPMRLREFTAGRGCGREVLRRLGIPIVPILCGRQREPLWPATMVGSITHCGGFCAAAGARSEAFLAVGIDAEVHRALPAGAQEEVLLDQERAWLRQAPRGMHWDAVLFSAKESLYKALAPLTGRWLGFEDAVVTIDPVREVFRAQVAVASARLGRPRDHHFMGRFAVAEGLVMTAVAIPRG